MNVPVHRRAWMRALAAILLGALLATSARSAVLIKSAELQPSDAGYTLEAIYDVDLTPTLEEALVRGLTLTFVTEFELVYPRWWTFNLWNRTVSEFSTQHRLSYNALARQYRLAFGSLHQSFDSVVEALAVLGQVRFAPAVRFPEVEPGAVYLAALRLRLDTSELPKPLQIDALASNDWSLSSDWYRWAFKP